VIDNDYILRWFTICRQLPIIPSGVTVSSADVSPLQETKRKGVIIELLQIKLIYSRLADV